MSTYICAGCNGAFESGRPEKEALAASREVFGPVPIDELSTVCDACWHEIRPSLRPGILAESKMHYVRIFMPQMVTDDRVPKDEVWVANPDGSIALKITGIKERTDREKRKPS